MTTPVRVICPRIRVRETAWKKLIAYVEACPKEVGGIGTVELKDGDMVVSEVHLLDQEVTGASTRPTKAPYLKFLSDYVASGKDHTQLRLWWHSHADMGVFWSERDLATMREYSDIDYLVSIVMNRKLDSLARLTLFRPVPLAIDRVPLDVISDIDEGLRTAVAREVKAKVREKREWSLFGRKKASPPAVELTLDGNAGDSEES